MNYTVSRDPKSGLYYAHHKKTPAIPVSGSLSEKQSEAREYARMYNMQPNKVQQIEDRRKAEFMKEINE